MEDFKLISKEETHDINVKDIQIIKKNYMFFQKNIENKFFNNNFLIKQLKKYIYIINEIELFLICNIFNEEDKYIYNIISLTIKKINIFVLYYIENINIINSNSKFYIEHLINQYESDLFYIEQDIFYEIIQYKNYFILYINLYSHILYIGYLITKYESYSKAVNKMFS
jgi:hypothetical protein